MRSPAGRASVVNAASTGDEVTRVADRPEGLGDTVRAVLAAIVIV